MSPTTRSGSGGGAPSPATPNAPRTTRTSSVRSSRSGVSSSPISPSKRANARASRPSNITTASLFATTQTSPRTPRTGQSGGSFITTRETPSPPLEPTPAPTLGTIPTEILELVINESLPFKMPVRLHTYGDNDNQLACKVHLPKYSAQAKKWRNAIQFGTVARDFRKVTKKQLKRQIRNGKSYIEVNMCGDNELRTFPDLSRAERTLVRPIDSGILDSFQVVKFVVPLMFLNRQALSYVLLAGIFTFRFRPGDTPLWLMDQVVYATVVAGQYTDFNGGGETRIDATGMNGGTLLVLLSGRANINLPDFANVWRIINEDFRVSVIEQAIMGRGLSKDLLTLQCALARMASFVNQRSKDTAIPGVRRDWFLDSLSSGVREEFSARADDIIPRGWSRSL